MTVCDFTCEWVLLPVGDIYKYKYKYKLYATARARHRAIPYYIQQNGVAYGYYVITPGT